uniref:Uncharacterized protein n=1 Tax=Compsopogon caeruleus TaxID=31354 RepID=A0A6T6DDA3_9RHOD
MATGEIEAEIEVDCGVADLCGLEEGQFVAACDDGTVRVIHSGGVLPLPSCHDDMTITVAVSPERKMVASGGADGVILCWDLHEPANDPYRQEGHKDGVTAVDWSGNILLSSSKDGRICVWDARNKPWQPVARVKVGSMALTAAFCRNGERILVGTENLEIHGHDLRGQAMTPMWREKVKAPVRKIRPCPHNSNICAISMDLPAVHILQVDNGDEFDKPILGHTDFIRGLSWDPQYAGKLLTGSWDKTVKEWFIKI